MLRPNIISNSIVEFKITITQNLIVVDFDLYVKNLFKCFLISVPFLIQWDHKKGQINFDESKLEVGLFGGNKEIDPYFAE